MVRYTMIFPWFGLIVMALFMVLAVWPEEADARFGRGGSFGSRGSRSFSTPKPAPPQRLATTQPTSGSQTASQSSSASGWKAGLLGGLGGLMLGGLLGSLLFGGGFDGIGLMDILLIAGGGFLIYRFFKSRAQEMPPARAPRYQTMGNYSYQRTDLGMDDSMSRGGQIVPPAPVPSRGAPKKMPPAPLPLGNVDALRTGEVNQGVEQIRAMDPNFDETRFLAGAQAAFAEIQSCWADWNVERLRSLVTERMWVLVEQQAQHLRDAGERNIIEKLQFLTTEVSEAWQEAGMDYITVHFSVRLVDYVTDIAGQLKEGSRDVPTEVEEYWTFTRPVGHVEPMWYLSAVQQPGEVARGAQ